MKENLSNLSTIWDDGKLYNAEARVFVKKYLNSVIYARKAGDNPIEVIEDDLYEDDDEFAVTNPLIFAWQVKELINDYVGDETDECYITNKDILEYLNWKDFLRKSQQE